ncbi:Oidioi.mRNA.OKI2018_I69.XSR.g13403.t1.cds [Oikopleura dioica]|uniref:Oidioi.mRNA.OKI2018_I69.XSR.g13403.t1.cds n=1 Tax=Oikopleura dioica TaxID=34765 RepID=A0ABN7SBG5_OIKDI|nr:Oidioi.mRNA.OKI2018_I69.XSR.g13403.t1.cds [Oikopleura dioica]
MSESSESNSLSSSEESESTQSQGNRSQSSAQESQTGSDNEDNSESKNSSPENGTEQLQRQREPTNWEAKYPYRFHPERDALMKECVQMAEYTMKPPIVKPWNPAKGRANNRGNYRGQNRNEQNHGGKRRRDF